MNLLKDELFDKLLQKTEELGHEVSHLEMRSDKQMPNPNDYAYYYGSFSNAAHRAYLKYAKSGRVVAVSENAEEAVEMSKKPERTLSPERTVAVISEIVDLFIKAKGRMPSARAIKKNHYITEEEVAILKENGKLKESLIRKIAEEKTGQKFPALVEKEVTQPTSTREEEKMKEEKTRGKSEHWTKERCEESLREACREARHVLTQSEVLQFMSEGKLPGWSVLQNKVGPWFLWGDMFSVPYLDDKKTRVANARKQKYLEAEKERKAAEERLKAKQEESKLESSDETAFPLAEAPEEAFVSETPVIEPEMESEVVTDIENDNEEVVEVEPKANECDMEMVEYPIKLILPKGVRGTVRLTLKF